uniref:Helicase ATP-binding domain-containing protein n=1 Tax=Corethron hystrix TaxID=216773 RepID=A0A7S1FWE6_9STRA|mmetsp:Transcript_33191/g.76588  ORF Transcript_33191/g.76588 Transcript_33191/m.76588 type:complete len:709 (+) Transcript_33191:102-2228(+)
MNLRAPPIIPNLKMNVSARPPSATDPSSETVDSKDAEFPPTSSSDSTVLELSDQRIPIHFPYPSVYDCQVKYMSRVLEALSSSGHALLESPTGTGKTLCLLSSALGWRDWRVRSLRLRASEIAPSLLSFPSSDDASTSLPPSIIYASRTHGQLSQVLRELRRTCHRPTHSVLAGREHLCVNESVINAAKTGGNGQYQAECGRLCKERRCVYKVNLDRITDDGRGSARGLVSDPEDKTQRVLDVEDLVKLGRRRKLCPYFLSRALMADGGGNGTVATPCELLLMPYNYLFEGSILATLPPEVIKNSIIIFDEAHNLESFASDASSFSLSVSDLAGCVTEVDRALPLLQRGAEADVTPDNVFRLRNMFLRLEAGLENLPDPSPAGTNHAGEYVFKFLEEAGNVTVATVPILLDFVGKIQELLLVGRDDSMAASGKPGTPISNPSPWTPRLDHFVSVLRRTFPVGEEGGGSHALSQQYGPLLRARARSYRVHVTSKKSQNSSSATGPRTIHSWCFASALAMRSLVARTGVRSVIVTSGTLAPLPSLASELGLSFPVRLENSHVINPEKQVHVRVIGTGVTGKDLSSSYERRKDPEYIAELGRTLAGLAAVIPGGMLVFFTSYSAMEDAIKGWGGPLPAPYGGTGGKRASKGKKRFFSQERRCISHTSERKCREILLFCIYCAGAVRLLQDVKSLASPPPSQIHRARASQVL